MDTVYQHLQAQAHRAAPFGITKRTIIRTAYRVGEAVRERGMGPNALVIVAEKREIQHVGESNGHYLCIIVRGFLPRTILLRRKGQRRLSGLPRCRYSPRWNCIHE